MKYKKQQLKLLPLLLLLFFYFLFSNFVFAQQPQPTFQLPPGPPLSLDRIMNEFLTPIANFLIAAGVIGGIITIVVAGVMYFKSGATETETTKAKKWFINGLKGAVIILGVGVIINSIAIFVTGEFTGFLPGGPGGGVPGGVAGGPGFPCVTPDQCIQGTRCRPETGICIRTDGNVEGEPCKDNGDCRSGFECKSRGLFGTGDKVCKPQKQPKPTKTSVPTTVPTGQTTTKTDCKLINVLTNKTSVKEGETIQINITGESKCNGKSITLSVCESKGCKNLTTQNFDRAVVYLWTIPKDFTNNNVTVNFKASGPSTNTVSSGPVMITNAN